MQFITDKTENHEGYMLKKEEVIEYMKKGWWMNWSTFGPFIVNPDNTEETINVHLSSARSMVKKKIVKQDLHGHYILCQ